MESFDVSMFKIETAQAGGYWFARVPRIEGIHGEGHTEEEAVEDLTEKAIPHLEEMERQGNFPEADLEQKVGSVSGYTPRSHHYVLKDLENHIQEAQKGSAAGDARHVLEHMIKVHEHLTDILPQIGQDVMAEGFEAVGARMQSDWNTGEGGGKLR